MVKKSCTQSRPEKWTGVDIVFMLGIVAGVCAIYWQVGSFDFITLDDPEYVKGNPNVWNGLTPDGVWWAFTSAHSSNWHPITWLSHMVDCHIWGMNPGAHHFVNVAIHATNSLLLFVVLKVMTGAPGRSALVAALFAFHPLHVESVAWISERKDVLSTLFWLLTMLAYVTYVKKRSLWSYFLCLILFTVGLMAKPMLVTLPCVLLLLDYWPLCRLRLRMGSADVDTGKSFLFLLYEKAPFFLLTVGSCIVTFFVQRASGAVASLGNVTLGERISNALVAYVRYLGKTFWPDDLTVFYTYKSWEIWQVALSGVFLVVVTVSCLHQLKRKPFLIVGWLWYIGTLVPVIGILQVGDQSMADRYTYIPLIGIFIMMVWLWPDDWTVGNSRRAVLTILSVAVLLGLLVLAYKQTKVWSSSEVLFGHAIASGEKSYQAHLGIGVELYEKRDNKEAELHFRELLRIEPGAIEGMINLANVLASEGAREEAVFWYGRAINEGSGTAVNARLKKFALNNLGMLFFSEKKYDAAIKCLTVAAQEDSKYLEARVNLATVFSEIGMRLEAIRYLSEALEIKRNEPILMNRLGLEYAEQGSMEKAISCFKEALHFKVDYSEAHYNLGLAFAKLGDLSASQANFEKAVELNDGYAQAHNNLGLVLMNKGELREALSHLDRAARLNPGDAETQNNLGVAFVKEGRFEEALKCFERAIKLKPDYEEAISNAERASGAQR